MRETPCERDARSSTLLLSENKQKGYVCVGKGVGGCQIALHNDSMFGQTKVDYEDLFEGKEKAWKAPSKTEKRRNATWIDRIRKMMMREDQGE